MATGSIKRLVADRGFGFIGEEGGTTDLFFHARDVRGASFEELRVGQRVEFDAEADPRGGGRKAANVRPAGASEPDEAPDSEDADAPAGPPPGTFTVRFESGQGAREGVERLSQGRWTLRHLTEGPDGSVTAEFAAGETGPDEP